MKQASEFLGDLSRAAVAKGYSVKREAYTAVFVDPNGIERFSFPLGHDHALSIAEQQDYLRKLK